MPLIPCPECGKEISDKAPACPQCGAPTIAGKKADKKASVAKRANTQGMGCLMIILSIALGLTVIGAPLASLIFVVGLIVLLIGLVVPA